jgi:hypothetical protein
MVEVRKSILYGIALIVFVGIISIVSILLSQKGELSVLLDKCNKLLTKEHFQTNTTGLSNQPLLYDRNIKIAPGNCKPYSGCFFPATAANPINPYTGTREHQPDSDKVWCEKSWRDCNAYQTCEEGRCVAK